MSSYTHIYIPFFVGIVGGAYTTYKIRNMKPETIVWLFNKSFDLYFSVKQFFNTEREDKYDESQENFDFYVESSPFYDNLPYKKIIYVINKKPYCIVVSKERSIEELEEKIMKKYKDVETITSGNMIIDELYINGERIDISNFTKAQKTSLNSFLGHTNDFYNSLISFTKEEKKWMMEEFKKDIGLSLSDSESIKSISVVDILGKECSMIVFEK